MRYPWVWLAAGDVATSIWIPPGGIDMSEDQEAAMAALLADLPGPVATRVSRAFELFEALTHARSRITTSACSRPIVLIAATATA